VRDGLPLRLDELALAFLAVFTSWASCNAAREPVRTIDDSGLRPPHRLAAIGPNPACLSRREAPSLLRRQKRTRTSNDLPPAHCLTVMWGLLNRKGADDIRKSRFTEAQFIEMIQEQGEA
jgi:hypothetical protein